MEFWQLLKSYLLLRRIAIHNLFKLNEINKFLLRCEGLFIICYTKEHLSKYMYT